MKVTIEEARKLAMEGSTIQNTNKKHPSEPDTYFRAAYSILWRPIVNGLPEEAAIVTEI